MRMWMIPPELLCTQHLVGEHGELHKHHHNFVKKHSIAGRVQPGNVQIEPMSMKARHDELVKYLKNHNSPYTQPDLSHLPIEQKKAKVDIMQSIEELKNKCDECRNKIEKWESSNAYTREI